jgi:hypothetical protein
VNAPQCNVIRTFPVVLLSDPHKTREWAERSTNTTETLIYFGLFLVSLTLQEGIKIKRKIKERLTKNKLEQTSK